MPKVFPKNLRPFLFHGVELSDHEDQAIGDCPFCGKVGKFSVEVSTGKWRCFVCGTGNDKGGGNHHVFLNVLWARSDEATKTDDDMREDRKLLYDETLPQWGACRSITTGDWIIPGYGVDGKVKQLYRYVEDHKTGKRNLLATPTLPHGFFRAANFDHTKPMLYVCEGPWDAMALYEMLRSTKQVGDDLALTANDNVSLANEANIIAVPGCGSIGEPFKRWLPLMAGKNVVLLFDSDHPITHNGQTNEPVGLAAIKRAVSLLCVSAEEKPASIHYLNWGEKGFDPELKSGYDVRDLLSEGGDDAASRIAKLQEMFGKIEPIPDEWMPGGEKSLKTPGVPEIQPLECTSWKKLQTAWRRAMLWSDGLDNALTAMLASSVSTRAVGASQLWFKIVGPAACGKSTLCEAMSISKKYVTAKSTIRGFHSGYKTDKEGAEDNSLIPQVADKTLITKDGDTLLQAPNKDQIFSEARDLYDSVSRTHYRNTVSRDYKGIRMTWVLCGTSALRSIDSSELGERFLDCVIMESIDEDMEDEVLMRVANEQFRNMSLESTEDLTTQYAPDKLHAMQLTGGYVEYLRSNAQRLFSQVQMSDQAKQRCIRLGKMVSFMRARPSTRQIETAEREFAARLVEQLMRLAVSLAVVLNKKEVDATVMDRVKKVAFDTARGRTLEIVRQLSIYKDMETGSLATACNSTTDKKGTYLRFLKKIGIVDSYKPMVNGKVQGHQRWKLTEHFKILYERACAS